jgi:hypothetical protein
MFKRIAAIILQKPINALFKGLVWLVVEINEEFTDTKTFKERAQHLKDTITLYYEELDNGKK